MNTASRKAGALLLAGLLTLVLAACSNADASPKAEVSSSAPVGGGAQVAPGAKVTPIPFNSEFTRDGTYQSHQMLDGIDFVYTIWASKTTPRTHEWFPKGDKYFSFTFQGYDMRRRLRDPFRTKRLIWLQKISVGSRTTTKEGAAESPYHLKAYAPDVTFDPQALQKRGMGMLITSPKGSFEIRNQDIKDMAKDTTGVTLRFHATVHIQNHAGHLGYHTQVISLTLPIAIFKDPTGEGTIPQPVPPDAM